MSIPTFGRKQSQLSSTIARDVERQPQSQHLLIELQYPLWWSRERVFEGLQALPEDPLWNSVISIMSLAAIVWVACETDDRIVGLLDILYNVLYAVHVLDSAYNVLMNLEVVNADIFTSIGFILDILSFSHFVIILETGDKYLKLGCYYLRLHRPFRYFWSKNNYNINGSVIGTTLMYCYMFLVLRVTWALVWFYTWDYKKATEVGHRRVTTKLTQDMHGHSDHGHGTENTMALWFFYDLYLVNKMFIPIGPSENPRRDSERIVCMLVMISGCLVVSGAAVASLSLVFSIYMKHEEYFRARYRLIMREMKESHVPQSLREKVETFYKMYWQKQKAVSTSELLLEFPPTIPASIYTDIYFKATQKSRILRELSYQFLTEVAKTMHTIHYIPGDTIIKRSTRKSSIIYITYGDVEMLTAEDDSTAILRMTRGTILSPCGPCPIAGCARAHVEIRAATFCTAHILGATELWKTAVKHGRESHHGALILALFDEHFDKVKRHFFFRAPDYIQYKSSILHFKQNLMNLQESKDEHGDSLLSHDDVMLEIAGCYVIRNRQYSSLTDETDAICLRSTFPCILQPTSSLQVAWHSFVACIIIVVCITHPYNLVYKKEISLEFRFYDYVVTVIYALDLIVHLSTGANVEDGIPISLAQTSSQQARSRWFVLDIVGTLPIFEFIGEGHFAGINKLLRLPKVFRVLKALEDECVYHSNVLRFFSFSLMILISCYLIAALQQGYMCFQYGWCQVSNFTHSSHWQYAPADDKKVKDSLVFSLYWSISMLSFTSHMESWVATYFDWNSLYTMLVLEVCIVLHIFIEAVYSATIMVTTAMRENFDASIEVVQNFLARNEVDPELRKRFITYLQLCWYNDKTYSASHKKKTIFHDLPPHVYQDIVTRQRSKYILCIPFIKLLLRDDLKNVSSNAKMFYTSPNEILLNTGDITNEMYVIKQGICEVLSPETMDVVAELGVRSHFGVLECLLRLPAFYTIRAVTHVQVFCISRKHLANALQIPKINDAIEYAKQQPEYSSLQVGRDRFVLYQPDSPVPNTVRFELPRKHEEDSAFLQPFNKLGFLSVLRYIFPRFSIRPDGRYLVHCEWLRATCALLSAIVFPGYPYLALQWPWLYFVAVVLDCSAYFDLFQRMLVGYFNDKGILVYHPSSTAEHYIRGAFLIDLFGCLPLEFLESPWRDSYQDKYKITMTKQVLMLNRLLQLYRTPSALLGLAKYLRRDIQLVINAIPLFLALINVLTCFMVLHSVSIYYSMNSENWYIVPIDDKGGSWIILFRDVFRFNIIETPWNLHLTCLFWVIYETTTTGYNCLNPSNLQLMQVLLCGMIIGTLIITYFSVRIISVRANVNKLLAAFQQDMKDMAAFMKREHLSSALQREILDYYINDWEKMGGTDYRNILKLCDQVTLRSDAILNIFGPTFMMCPILTQCDISLLRMMGRAVRSYYFLKGTVIVEKDDIISDLYLVDHGNVEINESRDNDESSVTLGKGSIFGNLEGPATLKCPMSVTATNRIHLLQINGKLFHDIIKDFPSVIQLLDTYRSINKNYIEGDLPTITSKQKKQSFISPVINRHRKLLKFFHFESPFTQIYFITISLSCVFADVYNAGFLDNRVGLIVALYVQDVAFCCKFLIQYFLPYVSEDDEDITEELLKIRKAYFTTEFKIDVLSCLPIELFCFLSHERTCMLFACLRLNRVLRIGTVYTSIRRYYKYFFTNLTITTIFCVLIWFTLFIHVSTCLWHFIGIMEEASARKTSWFYKDNGRRWCTNKYVCSLYFVLTTFTQNGVGDILPKKQKEVIFVSILQMVSTMMYMVYVGEFSNLIQYHSFRSFSYYCKYLELQEFLKNNRVSRNLIKLVNKYSLHLWQESRGVQVPYFLKNAPNCFKLKVMSAAYLHHLAGHHVFDCCEPAFLRQLVGHLRLYTYNKGTYVVKENEITNAMYIIHTGRVTETRGSETTSKVYYSGEYFGVVQGLVRDYPHTHSYQSISKSQILTLHVGDWEYLLDHFPNSKDCIFKYLTYDDDSSGNKEIDKFNKRERKITIAGNYAYRKKKVNDSYKKPSGTFSRVSFQSQESRSVPTSSNLVESKLDDKEKSDYNELKNMGLDNISPTSSMITEKAEMSLDRLKLDDDDILYQPNNSASEENTQSDNIEMYELTTRSVEDYIDQKHRHNSLASLYDESTQAREKVHNIKLSSKTDETEGFFGNADKSASRNDGTEQNDALVLNVDSKSSNESDSQTSISKRRQSKSDQPSI